MQRAEGGLSAHVAAPGPDLLSTFTGLVAAGELSCLDRLRLGDVARFARALVCEGGGFRGALSDDRPDVEYTYYGLGAVAVLAGLAAGASCCSECSCRAGGRAARPGAT